jgi:hypothetical protein
VFNAGDLIGNELHKQLTSMVPGPGPLIVGG